MNDKDKILLVDDDQIFRSEFKDCFEEYDIVEAPDGEEALKILKKPNEIDLVISDIKMPGMDGLEVLRKIKEMAPEMNVVILTGHGSKEVVIRALRGLASNYIEKPIDIEKTREIIESILAKNRGEADYASTDLKSKIKRVKRFVQRNCFKKVRLEDAASIVYLSPKYLSRTFKQYTGVGFSEYRLALKIKKAKTLLKKTGYNIDYIADKMGYQNTESFIRQFKKITGLAPTQYRKKINNAGKKEQWQKKS
ncbi:MAG: Two component transcriptional regulator, AraC family [Candidatus Gottesmanbacteria bacterium GW2011_GWC2_39_8]|uniref:Two component transcriptional regulator, AraC family n=3 Tax=Bacteria candidate phyla TaxID=1783234 RepID=A0A0G0PQK9_9BACT|nr:MAG: Two component transcriptional regulator, AraC family [Candidatus Gottesmanbacteria bacterium GW2011_GWC2_39_8]